MSLQPKLEVDGSKSLYPSDIYRYAHTHPKLWVYVRSDSEIYRANESRKDLDVFIAFREVCRAGRFCRHDNLINKQNFTLWRYELRTVVRMANKETLVVMDPWCECGFAYDDWFLITFAHHECSIR